MRISDWSSDVCSSDLADSAAIASDAAAADAAPASEAAATPAFDIEAVPVSDAALGEFPSFSLPAGNEPKNRPRSEERRVGKEGVRTCRSRGSPDRYKKKTPYEHRSIREGH